mgnify:CR=1 FL=1
MQFFGTEDFDGGPTSKIPHIRVAWHYDQHGEEWVVRLHHPKGMMSVCGCPGQAEATLVAACIAAVAATADCTFSIRSGGGDKVEQVECPNLVEFDSMSDSVSRGVELVLDFLA